MQTAGTQAAGIESTEAASRMRTGKGRLSFKYEQIKFDVVSVKFESIKI